MIMDFLSEKFALKSSQPGKNSDFYMGAGTLEHVMETLDNESFYSKNPASKCVQAFNSIHRGEQHHGRLERASPCQDNSGESQPSVPSTHGDCGQAPPAPVQQAVLVFPVCSFPALARFVFTFQCLHTREYRVDRQMINQLSSVSVHLQFVANRCSGNYSLDVTPLFVSANLD